MVAIKPLVLIFVVFAVRGADSHAIARSNLGIVGGHRVSIESVPFMVSIRWTQEHMFYSCGGSIIHEQFILTAAHCLNARYTSSYIIEVGTDDLETGGATYDVSKLIPHEEYCRITKDYDIGLVKLSTPLEFGSKVRDIALPGKNFKLKEGIDLQITGWGRTSPNSTKSKNLLQVTVPLVPKRICQIMYSKREITPRMLCAGGYGKNVCKGDSGGPLFLNDTLIGVMSLGSKICEVKPGVFTNVTALLPWIQKTISENLLLR